MFLRLVTSIALLLSCLNIYSQDISVSPVKEKFRKLEIPGSFLVEFGMNFMSGTRPDELKKGFWGSRTFNLYYQYPIRMFKSKFSFNPGLGLSLERFKLKNNFTFAPRPNPDGTFPLVAASTLFPGTIKRSQLVTNYIEMPLEFRFDTDPEDIARSFNFSLGGRIGLLFDSFTKVDYFDDGERKRSKDKQWHGLNRFRYSLLARIGISGLSFVGYYNLNTLFGDNKVSPNIQINTFTICLSINGF